METKSPDRLRSARRPLTVIGLLVVIGLIGGSVALASHSFNDVPNTHTFHEDIEWMKDTGVTRGCNPPANTEYCPDDFTTRGQMAAFFHRFAQAGVVDAATLDGLDSTEFVQNDGSGFEAALGASVYTNTDTDTWPAGADSQMAASCNAGDVLIGGGYQADVLEVNVVASYPEGEDWVVRGTSTTVEATVIAYVICVGS